MLFFLAFIEKKRYWNLTREGKVGAVYEQLARTVGSHYLEWSASLASSGYSRMRHSDARPFDGVGMSFRERIESPLRFYKLAGRRKSFAVKK